jgi:ribosomal-protein-alanine N-acetyltransferase
MPANIARRIAKRIAKYFMPNIPSTGDFTSNPQRLNRHTYNPSPFVAPNVFPWEHNLLTLIVDGILIPTLQTRRLLLRPLELDDAPQAQALFPHWEIVRFLQKIVPWPYPSDGAYTWCREFALPAMARGEEWHWTLRLKSSPGSMIGCITLRSKDSNNNRGFWLGLPWQGQGLMTEACEAVTGYWFDVLNFPVLRAPKAVPNIASRRISEKTGMRMVAIEEADYVSGRFPTEIWEITAEEWRARKKSRDAENRS